MLEDITEKQIFQTMKNVNPWWEDGKVNKFYSNMEPRMYLEKLYELLVGNIRRSVVLMGARRTGKTVIMHHIIDKLINIKKVNPKNILYISIDNPIFLMKRLQKLLNIFMENMKHKNTSKLYVFFDEIQYLDKWEIHLKSLHDTYLYSKFLVSGSAGSVLNKKSKESGAGRFADFLLPPIAFVEFLSFKKKFKIFTDFKKNSIQTKIQKDDNYQNSIKNDIEIMNDLFIEYINYGGFPEITFMNSLDRKKERIRISNDIVEKVLERDLPNLYGINNINNLKKFFQIIAFNTGNEFSLNILNQKSGLDKNTIVKYLEYLEASFLIKKISKIDQNSKYFKRETVFKIYLTNPSIRTALFGEIKEGDPMFGNLVENAIFSQIIHRNKIKRTYYSRWNNGEVDLIILKEHLNKIEEICEIKWSNRYINYPEKLKNLIKFIQSNTNKIDKETLIVATTKSKNSPKSVVYPWDFIESCNYCFNLSYEILKDLSFKKD